ncbi:MAG: helix-turn-helix transcriptional regulator [Oribacterium sp.]|nr:helix-turn-helix transcriptional regulator [Oribacterium sp.]
MNAREEALQAERPYYMTMLERRYTFEQHFIENIEAGNARSALMNLENMQHDVSYLKRIGTTPISFLNDYRLKQAAILLASTSSTVQEISNSVGIDDANYFVKLFRKKYEMTPTEYRRQNKL